MVNPPRRFHRLTDRSKSSKLAGNGTATAQRTPRASRAGYTPHDPRCVTPRSTWAARVRRANSTTPGSRPRQRSGWTQAILASAPAAVRRFVSAEFGVALWSIPQGGRRLTPWQAKDLRQVLGIPACHSATHGNTFLVINLLQQAYGEAFQPCHIVCGVTVCAAGFHLHEMSHQDTSEVCSRSPSDLARRGQNV